MHVIDFYVIVDVFGEMLF